MPQTPYTDTIYSEESFVAALGVIKAKPHLKTILGERTLATIEAALVIAANDEAIGGDDPDPESAGALAMSG